MGDIVRITREAWRLLASRLVAALRAYRHSPRGKTPTCGDNPAAMDGEDLAHPSAFATSRPVDSPPPTFGGIFFDDLLPPAFPMDERERRPFIAVISVDRFASLRHRIGPARAAGVIQDLSRRTQQALPSARLGRLGRTTIEVAFLASNIPEAEHALRILQAALEGHTQAGEDVLKLTVTIGFADSVGTWRDGSELINRAELALEQAQAAHTNLMMFSGPDEADATDRLALVRDLHVAGPAGQLAMYYQPKLRARTDTVDSVEALIRWNHPQRGMVPPDEFITLAEETGEIRLLTEWAICRSIEDRARLLAAGHRLTVYVNISGRLLSDVTFSVWVLSTLADVDGIGFEITETGVIDDPAGALANLRAYAAAGIKIAIDDYGSGWSSLAYLKELPATELKIDKMFISGLASSHRDPLIVRSTIDLAHALDMEVTAEGVETPATLALLRAMGCDLLQGYLIALPMPIDGMLDFLFSLEALGPDGIAPWAKPVNWFAKRA